MANPYIENAIQNGNLNIRIPNGAVTFPENNSIIYNDDVSNISNESELSISFWMNGLDNNVVQYLVFAHEYGNTSNYNLYCCIGTDGVLNFKVRVGGYYPSVKSTTTLSTSQNTWHHVVLIYNQTNIYIYVDGQDVSTTRQNYHTGVIYNYSTLKFIVGNCGTANVSYDSGGIYDVRVYSKALTTSEIDNLYNRYPVKDDDLVLNWRMNDNFLAYNIRDYSNNGYAGTMEDVEFYENGNITGWCSSWDEGNWDATIETFLHPIDIYQIKGGCIPGAVTELFNILGNPVNSDATFSSGNTLIFDLDDDDFRRPIRLGVKTLATRTINHSLMSLKIEGNVLERYDPNTTTWVTPGFGYEVL